MVNIFNSIELILKCFLVLSGEGDVSSGPYCSGRDHTWGIAVDEKLDENGGKPGMFYSFCLLCCIHFLFSFKGCIYEWCWESGYENRRPIMNEFPQFYQWITTLKSSDKLLGCVKYVLVLFLVIVVVGGCWLSFVCWLLFVVFKSDSYVCRKHVFDCELNFSFLFDNGDGQKQPVPFKTTCMLSLYPDTLSLDGKFEVNVSPQPDSFHSIEMQLEGFLSGNYCFFVVNFVEIY